MHGIETEGMAFLESVLSGMVVYSAYTCIRALRRVVKHNLFAIAAEDFFYWLGTAFYLFVQIYHTNNGSIRWYFILGVVLGGGMTFGISRKLAKMRKKMYERKAKKSEESIEQIGKKG